MWPSIAEQHSRVSNTNDLLVTSRLISSTDIRLSEIMAALSVALDITQGQPEGHCMRTALIGMRLAEALDLPTADRSALFYARLRQTSEDTELLS